MYLEELKEILGKYDYQPHYIHIIDKHNMVLSFLSIKYYAIPIKVVIIKLNAKERIVKQVQIDKIKINDVEDLHTTLNGLHKMNKKKELIQYNNHNNIKQKPYAQN